MPSNIFSYEAPYLRAALLQLKTYLLSEDIFRNLGLSAPKEQSPYPQFSLANLLLAQARVQAAAQAGLLSAEQGAELSRLDQDLDEIHQTWQSAWSAKATKEFAARLRQWARFLNDLSSSSSHQENAFLYGLRIRALLQLLLAHLPSESSTQQAELTLLDQGLKQFTQPADFVWQPQLSASFPPESFYFLYTSPKTH